MFLPLNPLLLPMPKSVQCPKCLGTWFWRTWYLGSEKPTCSKCKSSVTPIEIRPLGNCPKLIKCPKCNGLQWYTGSKSRSACTANGCGKKNIIVHALSVEDLSDILQPFLGGFSLLETEEYYLERIKEYNNG
jgi:DnaJ-class molecular chaperone